MTAVKHFVRILAAPFPKGIKFRNLVWGLFKSSQSELTINILLVKKSVFWHFASEAFFLVIINNTMQHMTSGLYYNKNYIIVMTN